MQPADQRPFPRLPPADQRRRVAGRAVVLPGLQDVQPPFVPDPQDVRLAAVELFDRLQAAEAFVNEVDPGNRLGLAVFSDNVRLLVPLGSYETVRDDVLSQIRNLRADGAPPTENGLGGVGGGAAHPAAYVWHTSCITSVVKLSMAADGRYAHVH